MKWHTIKSEKTNTRENGKYASYPIYEHETGELVASMECYASDVNHILKMADKRSSFSGLPIYERTN